MAMVVAATAEPLATRAVERSKVCMMQDEVEPKAGTPLKHDGKTYYVCCPMCAESFKKDPAHYSKAQDPVSGKLVDKATAPILAYKDRAYFFASKKTEAAFAKDPERYVKASSGPDAHRP
jgi:YHS domain-containing protein